MLVSTPRRYTDDAFRAALADPEIRTLADLCRALGIVPRGANYGTLRTLAQRLDIDLTAHLRPRRRANPSAPRRPRRSWTDQELLDALTDPRVTGYADLCRALGLQPYHATYARLRRRAHELGTPLPAEWSAPGTPPGTPRPGRRAPLPYDREQLAAAIAASRTRKEVLQALGEPVDGVGYARLRRAITRWRIDARSLTGRAARRPLEELLVKGRRIGHLRARLLEEGSLAHRCDACGRIRWEGRPIPLELDHIDGDPTNNELGNLRLLCPNCHAQTPTYRGRNIRRTRSDDTEGG